MDPIPQTDFVIAHTLRLTGSYRKWTGRDLLPGNFSSAELAENIFNAPFVVVSHGTQSDPILNYGNRAALALWEMSWEDFTRTPSRLTAEAPNREERAKLLEAVTRKGFSDNYSGIRISKNGRRFEIFRATVWNLVLETGEPAGQAATFSEWRFL
jgi:hypothetical protein